MSELPITYFVNVSVQEAPPGLGQYSTANLGMVTRETPNASFGTDGYKIYTSPTEIETDFGTNSNTYRMAVAAFSQSPNLLTGGGYLVVITALAAGSLTDKIIQTVTFSNTPDGGAFKLQYGATKTSSLTFGATAANVQTALRAISGLSTVTVTGSFAAGFRVYMAGVASPVALMTAPGGDNTLVNGVTATVITITAKETFGQSITRSKGLVQYFGVMPTEVIETDEMLEAAAVVQALNKIAYFVSYTAADVDPGGRLDQLRTGTLTKSRGLYYGEGLQDALRYAAAYASRAQSTNFSGSNTTQSMHGKNLATIDADSTMTETLLAKAKAAGADIYASFQGVSRCYTSGTNKFFDQVFNRGWLVGALEVAGFNYIAGAAGKIPQTETGMDGLKGAYRSVCEQARTNGYVAPGSWTSAVTFGDQQDFVDNIAQVGYYIFSSPVADQLQADREDRDAPLVQIAIKEAGAIHESSVIVNINA